MIFYIPFLAAILAGLCFRRGIKVVSALSAVGSGILIFESLTRIPDIDGLSRFFAFLVGVGGLAVSVYSIGYMKPRHLVPVAFPTFLLSMAYIPLARNFATMLIFWEIMTISSYVLVMAEYESEKTRNAGMLYLLTMQGLNSVPLLLAFGYIYHVAGTLKFNMLMGISLPTWVLFLMFLGFATKGGIFPLHFWLPEAHPVAPSNASALLSGVMLKMAVYGMLRSIEVFNGWESLAVPIVVLSTLTIMVGSLLALGQNNIKRMMAYSSVDNLGYIFLAIGSYLLLDGELRYLALAGALLHSFNHMTFKGLLFMLSGNIMKATGRGDFGIRGLGENMKVTEGLSLVGILSISGIPPTNGFVSKLLIYMATLSSGIPMLVIAGAVALLGSTLTLAAYVKFYRLFTGTGSKVEEAPLPMLAGELFLGALCILSAVFPNALLSPAGVRIDVPVSSSVIASGFALLLGVIAFSILPKKGMKSAPWTTGEDVPPELFEIRPEHMVGEFSKPVFLFQMAGKRSVMFLRRVWEAYSSIGFEHPDWVFISILSRGIYGLACLVKESVGVVFWKFSR